MKNKYQYNRQMSQRFRLSIFNSKNPKCPYFVQEWGECFTLDEIVQNTRVS